MILGLSDFLRHFGYRYKYGQSGYRLTAFDELIPNMYILWGI